MRKHSRSSHGVTSALNGTGAAISWDRTACGHGVKPQTDFTKTCDCLTTKLRSGLALLQNKCKSSLLVISDRALKPSFPKQPAEPIILCGMDINW